jgi:hypothetical protein
MAGKSTSPLDLPAPDIEVTDLHRFTARLKLADDATVVFMMMGLLEPLKRLDEGFAQKARTTFAEVLHRWVPNEIAEAGADFMVGESETDPVVPDEKAVEACAYIVALHEEQPDLLREAPRAWKTRTLREGEMPTEVISVAIPPDEVFPLLVRLEVLARRARRIEEEAEAIASAIGGIAIELRPVFATDEEYDAWMDLLFEKGEEADTDAS